MAFDGKANFAIAPVITAPVPSLSGMTIVVQAGAGELFATPPYNLTVWEPTPPLGNPIASKSEIVRVEKREGDVFTLSARAQEGTTAKPIGIGWVIADTITVKALTDVQKAIESEKSGREAADNINALAISSEKTRAEGMEALKATIASLNSEVSNREAGDNLRLLKAENLKDITSASAARANLGLGSAAVESSAAFDAKGEAAAERARAEGVEVLKAPLASPALTGVPTAPTATAGTNSSQVASTAFVSGARSEAESKATAALASEKVARESGDAEAVKLTGTQTIEGVKTFNNSPVVPSPIASNDAVSLEYMQSLLEGITPYANVNLATAASLPTNVYNAGTLTGVSFGALTIDGVTPSVGQRVLIKNETTQANNGIYVVTHVGAVAEVYVLTRSSDMSAGSTVKTGALTYSISGNTNSNKGFWVVGVGPFTVGTSPLKWEPYIGAQDVVAGEGISISGNTVSIASPTITSTSVGFAPSVIWLDTTPEFYGALGNEEHNDTAAFQLCAEAIKAAGGGVMRLSSKTYLVDGFKWLSGVSHEGRSSRGKIPKGTILKAVAGSSNQGLVEIPAGTVNSGGWKNITFLPNGNEEQDAFYLYAQEEGLEAGGVNNCIFENLQIGNNGSGEAWLRNCMWWRGGAANFTDPHQFNRFKNVRMVRDNTGAKASTSRCLKASGQCEKFEFDAGCVFNGRSAGVKAGTNIELTREFLLSTTLSAEVNVGGTEITLSSVSGFEVNKRFSMGEGNFNELCQVESISGNKIKLKTSLAYSHASGTNVYLLSGTVASPASQSPAEFSFELGAIQNADLAVLTDGAQIINFNGTDMEECSRDLKRRNKSLQVNFNSVRVANTSEGTARGEGSATVGSKILTGITGSWTEGEKINGPGIKTTVAKVLSGTELELTATVTSNGTENATVVKLISGGSGEGYVTLSTEGSQGKNEYQAAGAIDRGDVVVESGVIQGNMTRATPVTTQTSTGVTLAIAASANITIYSSREVVLTNAAATVKTIIGQHGTGQAVTFRSTTANTTFETGGNLYLSGNSKLILQVGDFATFLRTDYSSQTWVLVGVQRSKELSVPLGTNGLVYPLGAAGPVPLNGAAIGVANKAWFGRVVVPEAGVLEKLKVFLSSVVAGETKGAIFDCGEAHAGNITVLWESSAQTFSSSEKEKLAELGNPKLSVVQNQQLIFGLMSTSTTATFGRTQAGFSGWVELGEGFLPSSANLSGRLAGQHEYGASFSFGGAGAQLSASNFLPGGNIPGLIAYV